MSLATTTRRLALLAPSDRINLGLAALLWSYSIARAARLSFTHDESVTFQVALRAQYLDIARYDVRIPSNNHMLNSLLAKLCSLIASVPFALRLPNVIAHGGYLGAALLLARRADPGPPRVLAFVVLTLHPFLLDFFSLCRGYGLASGFELLALWLLVRDSEDARIRPVRVAIACLVAALCPLSNLSFLVFFLAFLGILLLIQISKARASEAAVGANPWSLRRALLASLGVPLAIAALLCAWLVPVGLKLREMGELYYGGEQGFLQDTLGSLLEASTYYKPPAASLRLGLQALGVALLGVALALALRLALRRRYTAAWLCALPLLTALTCVVQHQAMDTRFPIDRTALFFIPMFALALLMSSASAARRGVGTALLGAAALLLLLNAGRSLNLRYFAQWQYDANTARMLRDLSKARGAQSELQLGANWLFEPTINYYRKQRKLKWLNPVSRSSLHEDADYYYYLPEDEPLLAPHRLQVIRHYETSGATLARVLRTTGSQASR